MPRAKIKALEDVDPIISTAFRKAFANPGATVVVAEHLTEALAINLQVRMKAVRQGFRTHFPEDHEYHRAAKYERLWVIRERVKDCPGMRNVVLKYFGMIKRPSEDAAEYIANMQKEYLKQLDGGG